MPGVAKNNHGAGPTLVVACARSPTPPRVPPSTEGGKAATLKQKPPRTSSRTRTTTPLVPPPRGGGNDAALGQLLRKTLRMPSRTWTTTSSVPPPTGGGNDARPGRKLLREPPWTWTTTSPVPPPAGGGSGAPTTPPLRTSPPTPLTIPPSHTPSLPPSRYLVHLHIPPPLHSTFIPRRHNPRGRSCTPGFPGDRFFSLGGTGGLHPRHTPSYIHAAHHSRSLYTPPTRPLMTGSPQAETGTYVYCHRRRRRHRCRHDGAVAHPAQPPAAIPRCRILPISSLADRTGPEPARCRNRVGRGLSAGRSPFKLGLLVSPPFPHPPPSPPPPSQHSTLPPPDSHTHPPYTTHTHTYTHT